MRRRRRTTMTVLAGVGLAGAAALGTAGYALAQDGTQDRLRDGVAEVLSRLVDSGTITQEQADAVAGALADARDQRMDEMRERMSERQEQVDSILQDVLGLSAEEVAERLAGGETLREIAGDQADELVDAVVAAAENEVAAAVDAGRLTQEQADRFLEQLPERVEDILDRQWPRLGELWGGNGPGWGPGGPFGHGGPFGGRGGGPFGQGGPFGEGRQWQAPGGDLPDWSQEADPQGTPDAEQQGLQG